jgi:hypothetical protein
MSELIFLLTLDQFHLCSPYTLISGTVMAIDDTSAARIDAARPFTLTISRQNEMLLHCTLKVNDIGEVWAQLDQIVRTLSRSLDRGTIIITDASGRIVIRTGLRSMRARQ